MTRECCAVLLAVSLLTACRAEPNPQNGAIEARPSVQTGEGPPEATAQPTPTPPAGETAAAAPKPGACDVQDGSMLPHLRIRAVGTEPFWGARVEGRCVTYSHPDDQAGTRIWTRFDGSASAGRWTGALNGRPFVLRTRAEPDCSDGMSDRRYPIAVSLTVGGEEREGCAEPI